MKLLFLNGSPKKDGGTARVLKHIRAAVGSEHASEWFDVYDLSVKPCIGCLLCRPDQECKLPEDDAQRIGRKIADADLLIVGTPNYWGNMSGPLKNLFDRSVTVFETFSPGPLPKPRLQGKKAVIVTSSGTPWPFNLLSTQSGGTVRAVKTVLTKGGIEILGVINYGGVKPKANVPERIQRLAKRLGNKMSQIKDGRINR